MRWVVKVLEPENLPGTRTFGQYKLQYFNIRRVRELFRTAGFRDYSSDKRDKFYVEHHSVHAMLMLQIQHASALADCVIIDQ